MLAIYYFDDHGNLASRQVSIYQHFHFKNRFIISVLDCGKKVGKGH